MSVIGHDQKQLQVRGGMNSNFFYLFVSINPFFLQDNILFEIDRIAARMSEQVQEYLAPCSIRNDFFSGSHIAGSARRAAAAARASRR